MEPKESDLEFFKQMFGGSWITQGISVAAELGIADMLAGGPKSAEQLAGETKTHPNALYRLLRALAGVGVFSEGPDGVFSQTPRSELLRSDVPASHRAFAIMMGSEFYQVWGELLYSIRTGKSGRERTESQYARLLSAAGLKLDRVVPTAADVSVIEAVRAS